MSAIALPDGRLHVPVSEIADPEAAIRAMGLMTVGDDAQLRAVEDSSYFLVHNDGPERFVCARCGRREPYYTLFCVPRPWKGLREALYGYWRNVGAQRPSDLTPAQRQRLRVLSTAFGARDPKQSLHESHPETARALGTGENQIDRGATVLGSLEPISRERAFLLANQINAKAHGIVIRL